ncbi:MAG: poly-beta-1,6 N-acetyl-D-glucosamine export porin PgaA [Castellaniella sp.]|uniref:poly-beta-1,6 N-acetyl-D-glucosamine export porin PgaA n=1 Tax=Castellaniella sp. TaxID=1955812 RepID=UPI003C787EE7
MNDTLSPAVFTFCTLLALPAISAAAAAPGDQTLIREARAQRDARQWSQAIQLFSLGERRFPGQPAFAYGHIMTLADAGRLHDAIERGKALVALRPDDPDAHLALAYAYGRNAAPYAALEHASDAYSLAPDRAYVIRAYVLAQQDARLPHSALQLADAHPGLLSPAQTRSLQADAAAHLVRAAMTASRGEADRYALADQALAMYETWIPAWDALGPAGRADADRARADRLQALSARRRPQDVVAAYEAMRAQGRPIPAYVLDDVASAYLALRQPEKAEPLFRQSLASQADRPQTAPPLQTEIGLFYALTESDPSLDKQPQLDQATESIPVWVYHKGDPARYPNAVKLEAALASAMATLHSGRTLQAQHQLDAMVELAPNNSRLRAARAQVYRARGLPRHAEADLQIAQTQDPRSILVMQEQAGTALMLHEPHEADLLIDDLLARAPEDPAVQRLADDRELDGKAELQVTGAYGVTSDSPVLGSRDLSLESTLYSPPVDDHWRGFAGTGYSQAEFEEGNAHLAWMRAGAQWRNRDITAQAEVSANRYGFGTRAGASAAAEYSLDDRWRIAATAALNSRDTPLKALRHDITSHRFGMSIHWRGDERREWSLAVSPSYFSDGNRRIEVDVSGRQRLYTTPGVRVDALLGLSASHNSAEDTPYFNPKSDFTALPMVELTHTLYQRYDTRWEQRFLVGAGLYAQRDHGSGALYQIGYGQNFRYARNFEVGVLLTGTSRPYDGQRERDFRIVVSMTYRF